MWPRITGRPLRSKALACWQVWLWFRGMMIATTPWHIRAAARRHLRLQRPIRRPHGPTGHCMSVLDMSVLALGIVAGLFRILMALAGLTV